MSRYIAAGSIAMRPKSHQLHVLLSREYYPAGFSEPAAVSLWLVPPR